MQDVAIAEYFASLGYEGEAAKAAMAVLAESGLTRLGKSRIAVNKLRLASEALAKRFVRACTGQACQAEGARCAEATGKTLVTVAREHCEVCGGSENARAVTELARTMSAAGIRRLLVVGGTPNTQSELLRLMPDGFEVRFVSEGTKRTAKEAAQDNGWADFIVIWASTPIGHKITELYKQYRPLTVSRRSVSALAADVVQSIRSKR